MRKDRKMKRWLASVSVLLLLALLAQPADAGRDPERPWSVGVSAGVNLSEASGDSTLSTDGRWGPIFGGFVNYRVTPLLVVALEVNWLLKGSTDMFTASGDTLSDVRASYLEFPLTLNLLIPAGENWDLGVYAGVGYAFQTDISARNLQGVRVYLSEKENEWNIPLGAGFAYYFPGSGQAVGLDLRYSIGMSDIAKDFDAKSKSWQLFLRYGFPF
jgi:hypothetical protein